MLNRCIYSFLLVVFALAMMSDTSHAQDSSYKRGDKVLIPAPVGMDNSRLGMGYPKGLSRLDEKQVIPNEVKVVPESSYRAVFQKQTNSFQFNASASALNILSARAGNSQETRHAVLTVYNVSKVASLTASPAQATGTSADVFISKIYYGWALNVSMSGESTSFTTDVAARLQRMAGAGGSVRSVMEAHDLRSEVSLRGLTAKADDVPIALTWQEVKRQFSIGDPQPILVEYTFLRDVDVDAIEWKDETIETGRYRITQIQAEASRNKRDGRNWDIMSTADVKVELEIDGREQTTIGFPRNQTFVQERPNKLITLSSDSILRFTAYDEDSTREASDHIGTAVLTFDEIRRAAPNEPIQVRTRGQLSSLTITLAPVR